MLGIAYLVLLVPLTCSIELPKVDFELTSFLNKVNSGLVEVLSKQEQAEWFLEVNEEHNETALQHADSVAAEALQFIRSLRTQIAKFKRLSVADLALKRKLNLLPDLGYGILGRDDTESMHMSLTNLKNYQLQGFQSKCFDHTVNPLENTEQLRACWTETSKEATGQIKKDWQNWLELYKKTANLHGYAKASDYWLKEFDMKSDEVLTLMQKFMEELKPIFVQFQAYIRHRLRLKLGQELLPHKQPIPFDLYDTFVQTTWDKIEAPNAETKDWNISGNLIKRGLNNAKRAFLNIAEFYRTLGFPQLPHDFFQLNALPTANTNKCSHKLWNFFGKQPVQLSFCPKIDAENFFEMFEAVSELFFFNAVQTQPVIYQKEPLSHFNDGIAKFFTLIANSPNYLEKLKLTDEGEHSKEQQLNFLYKMGFRHLLPLPMLYITERYRTQALNRKSYKDDNCYYWQMVEELMGAVPPVARDNADFDIADKLVIDAENELASAFMSIIFKFQIFKHFCEQTGQFVKDDPSRTLDKCDLTDQRIVGQTVLNAMSLGASVSYREVMQRITGEDQFNTDGIIEYFKPLFEWLEEQNDNNGVEIGWESTKMCKAD